MVKQSGVSYSGSRYGSGGGFTPTGFGTLLAEGKETRHIDGKDYVLNIRLKLTLP
jgi:acyl CoA:acetate/3-ketoacid CoA transferase alpha subunit